MTGNRSGRIWRGLAIGTLGVLLASSGAGAGAASPRECDSLETCAAYYLEKAKRMGWAGFSLHVCTGDEHTIEGTNRLAFPVQSVSPESPAALAGIRVGDRVAALNGVELPVAGGTELWADMAADLGIGDRVRFRVLRDDRPLTFTIKMAEPPSSLISQRVLYYLALRFGPRETARYLDENPLDLE